MLKGPYREEEARYDAIAMAKVDAKLAALLFELKAADVQWTQISRQMQTEVASGQASTASETSGEAKSWLSER
ncbi:MAG: hypothetical protein P4L71_21005 [Acetobacteraceae bacterium]|nr:hypothetical protein [Acetobacteraceae bacterium]